LKGERFDGNAFARQALEKGALLAVVSDPALAGDGFYVVDDTLVTLQELAREHRRSLRMPVLGITGSNGKTTTKELIAAVTMRKFNTSFTSGNLNNHIGVPLSILSIPEECEFAIIEMGANHVGEIAELCTIAMPDHGLITNIGMAHIEGFGGREGIKKGKSELYDWLARHDGLAFVNTDEEFLSDLSAHVDRRVFYGTDDVSGPADYLYQIVNAGTSISIIGKSENTHGLSLESDLFGDYNARNILTAATIGLYFGVSNEDIQVAVAQYLPENNRSQLIEKDGKCIILDAYNANPTSMHLALSNFRKRPGTKAVILGGMNELGSIEKEEHIRLVEAVSDPDIRTGFLVGPHFEGISLPDGLLHFQNVEELREYLSSHPFTEEAIFVKGSRSLRLESALGNIH
jgi:UDP-N-acetylmuramoyl-tripeptide--D-alanyl-D-alanine ligase